MQITIMTIQVIHDARNSFGFRKSCYWDSVSLGGLNMRIKLWKVEQYHNPLEKKVGNSVNTSLCTMYVTSPHDLGIQ
jgi:hypothetical protein